MIVYFLIASVPAHAETSRWSCQFLFFLVRPKSGAKLTRFERVYVPSRTEAGPSDGKNLIIRAEGYGSPDAFTGPMGHAVNQAVGQLQPSAREGKVTEAQLVSIVDNIFAPTRKEIALTLGDSEFDAAMFDRPLDQTHPKVAEQDKKKYRGKIGSQVEDITPFGRGAAVFTRAKALAGKSPKINIDGKDHPLSAFYYHPEKPNLVTCFHPNTSLLGPLRKEAYRLLAEALNSRELSAQQVDERLARAHYLLIQAPPYLRGSASYAHALVDTVRRVKLGYGLPRLKESIQLDFEPLLHPDIDTYVDKFVNDFFEK